MKKISILAVFSVIFLVVLLTPVAQAQMILKETEISRFVPLPWDVKVVSPDQSLSEGIRALSGRWEGKWDTRGMEGIIIVEKINESSARIVYGWGKSRFGKDGYQRYKCKVVPGSNPKILFSGTYSDFTFTLSNDLKTLSGDCEYRSSLDRFKIIMHKVED